MQLKDLQKVARKTIAEELAFETFRGALARALGPALVIDCPVDEFIENVNEQLDILELTGKSYRVQVPTSVLLPLAEHKLAGVRKVVARLISEDRVTMFAKDTDVSVRAVVARRAPLEDVKRMAVHEGRSDLIKSIYRQRALFESGIPNVKPIKEPFTMYADKAMGKSGKSPEGPELSDQWYETKAQELFDTYGQDNIEYNWEEIAVHRLCSSARWRC